MTNLAVTKMCFYRVAMTAYMLGHPAWEAMYLRLATPKKLLFTQAFKSKSSNSVQLLSFLLLLFRNVKLYQNQWHITNMFPKTSTVCYTDSQHFSSCKPWMLTWGWGTQCKPGAGELFALGLCWEQQWLLRLLEGLHKGLVWMRSLSNQLLVPLYYLIHVVLGVSRGYRNT